MSKILEVIVGTVPEQTGGFAELLAHWGGESYSADPRTFSFGSVHLTLRPVAPRIRSLLKGSLRASAQALVMDEHMVLRWVSGQLSPEELDSLKGLFTELANQMSYVVVVEGESGLSTTVDSVPSDAVCQFVGGLYRNGNPLGLSLLLVDAR